MTGKPAQETEAAAPSDEIAELTRRIAQVEQERDYLLLHAQNLETELRRASREPGRLRELERRLADAEGKLRRVSVVHMGRWLLLEPGAAARSIHRRLREGVLWRMADRLQILRSKRRRFGA